MKCSERKRKTVKQGKSKNSLFVIIYYVLCANHLFYSYRDIYDKMKGEIRIMKEELSGIERYRGTKEKSAQQCKSNLEAMIATKEGLESELHQDLMEQLSVADQHQVCFIMQVIIRLHSLIMYVIDGLYFRLTN